MFKKRAVNELTGTRAHWYDSLREMLVVERPSWTGVIAWSTAIFGIVSGYSLYILWWDQVDKNESGWSFALAFGAAAVMSFLFEVLRGAIEGNTHPWSRSRVVSTVVMLAAFELYIIAAHTAIDMPPGSFTGIASTILGEQFAEQVGPLGNLLALGTLWSVVALTIVLKLRKFILGWPYPDSDLNPQNALRGYLSAMRPDLWRGVKAGFMAGVVWGTLATLAYVFFFRSLFLAQWIHSNYSDWIALLWSHRSSNLPGLIFVLLYGPPFLAGLLAKYFGAFGLVLGVVAASFIANVVSSKENKSIATVWPALTILIVMGSPIFATPEGWHDLIGMAYLSIAIWGVPAILLGALAPFLRRPAHNPPVWGLVASAAAVVMLGVTMARFFADDSTATERGLLSGATALLLFLALQLFRGSWSEEFWLLVALSIGTIIWGTTTLMAKASVLEMQREAHTLIGLPFAGPETASADSDFLSGIGNLLGAQSQPVEMSMLVMLPNGLNMLGFSHDACADVQTWTPDQRAQYDSVISDAAAAGHKRAQADMQTAQNGAQQLDQLEERIRATVAEADSLQEGTPGEEIKAVRALDANLSDLDDSITQLQQAEKPGGGSMFLGYGQPHTVCQPDMDLLLQDLEQAASERDAASARLGDVHKRVSQELPAFQSQISDKRSQLEASREALQLEQAQHLELTLTSSLGFWATIGLLAVWRLSEPGSDEPEHH